MQLVEDASGDIETVFCGDFGGEHLVDAACGLKYHPLGGGDNLDSLTERGRLPNHITGDIKHNSGLLAV